MSQLPLFDAHASTEARDAALLLVSDSNTPWIDRAAERICASLRGQECIGEDFRKLCEEYELYPKSPKAWGALTNHLARSGRIVDTGRVRKMTDKRSHARRSPVWKVL